MVNTQPTLRRREQLKATLAEAAERRIETAGLGSLRARALADEVGCAVGAIYNVVKDLDDLVLLVNSRTLAALERQLGSAGPADGTVSNREEAIDRLVRMALAYLDFAAANTLRWRALFEHRMPKGETIPDWYLKEQQRLFGYVERVLSALQTDASPKQRALHARSLFSAVHGLVVLGLEEKLQRIPLPLLRQQMTFVVSTIGRGMMADE
jgi:AcrR family transcriptional regulator